MVDRQALVVALLLLSAAADLLHSHTLKFTLPNVTRFNVEEKHQIVVGNQQGDLEIHSDKNSPSIVIPDAHNVSIVFIEQYEHDEEEEYVVVDQGGRITIWNENFSLQLAELELDGSVSAVTIRERERGVGENRLALVIGEEVVEYSLDSRTETARHNFNKTILTAIYTQSALLVSTNDSILVIDDNGNVVREIATPQGSITLMSRHNHNTWANQPNEIIAIATKEELSSLLHVNTNGVDSAQSLSSAVSSLTYCRGRKLKGKGHIRRRVEQDLIVLGIGQDVLQVREGAYRKALSFPQGVADVVCLETSLYVLAADGQLRKVELQHIGNKSAAFVGAFFVFILMAVFAYQMIKRRYNKLVRKSQSVHGPEEYELQERILIQH